MADDQNLFPNGPDGTPNGSNPEETTPPAAAAAGGGDGGATPPGSTGPGALFMIPINIEEEMRRSYLDYSMSVIIGRALPDVRDGLKPVHRRILYAMQEMGLQANKKYTKCAKVVGHAMGNYHPHGDSAIYDAMVRLAQPFSMRYPLVDGQGNFGSVDGDPPAAMRYTEARLQKIAGEMLADIDMDTVDFTPNYDESTLEPTVLPAKFPNLIVNGSSGIAVGMATNIPPHNLTEIVSAAIALVNATGLSRDEELDLVLSHVQGPDFPTGGFIFGKRNIREAYRTGRGRFLMRAKCATEDLKGGRESIIVNEIPYQVNKNNLIKRIAELVTDKVIEDISDVRDESDRDGMRIVIELKRGAQPEIVLNQLFKNTSMQESFSMIFLAVHNGQPRELPLPDAIRAFIEHRIDVVRRRTAFLLGKAREREHLLLGYQIALDYLDQVIRIIRNSNNRADARENLFAFFSGRRINLRGTELAGVTLDAGKYGVDTTLLPVALAPGEVGTLILSYRQIDAILELQLYRLTQLSIDEILNELNKVRDNIAEYESILASEKKLRKVIVKELEEIRDKYGDVRRTIIVDETAELQLEDLIADEQVAVTVSHSGYLKRTPISTYRQQRRGGTGRLGMKTREEDFVASLIVDSTHAYLLFFTNTGRVFWMKIYEIPDVASAGKGKHMASMLALQPGEKIVNYLAVRDLKEEGKFVFFATREGVVKKTPLVDFSNVMARGIIAINIDKDDELIAVRVTSGDDVVFLATREGMAIRFEEKYDPERSGGLRPMGRNAGGNKGITLKKSDYVIGAAVTPSEASRNRKRLEFAAKLDAANPPKPGKPSMVEQVQQAIDDIARAKSNTPLELEGDPNEVVVEAGTPENHSDRLDALDKQLGVTPCLILTVSENGFGKRTDVDAYRLQSRGGKGVINMRTTPKIGKVSSIQLVDETTELMVISQFGKIIRIDTKTIRAAGRATMGVKLLDLDDADKVAAAVTIPPEEVKEESETKPPTIQ
ncbi:DNA gyrase subunit A [Terriglobus roseus]|uniref:DNA gyrase subunit A n=1 Tax=Terriglobus roseus TaxID=392734 RepID=A0A1H4LJI0_9BACT|nr:DNA gyrase subunit A [Terriglobus roseus]SEB70880.1 DNA gyrase subunit A [Terriglobus roseus]